MAYYNLINEELEELADLYWQALINEAHETEMCKSEIIYKGKEKIPCIRLSGNIKNMIQENVLISKINTKSKIQKE